MSWKTRCESLEHDLSLCNFFEVLCSDRDNTFAIWLDGDKECSYSYDYLYRRAYLCADKVKKTGFGIKGGYVGIAVDTCPEWAQIFWGLLAAGRNPLLLDPSLPDERISHLLREAGATSLITRKKRDIAFDQRTPEEILPDTDTDTIPEKTQWADNVAVCTSGTTATSRVFVYNGAAICRQAIGFAHHQPSPCITCEENGPLKTLSFLPLNHIFGLMTNIIATPFQSCPQVYLKDRAPQTIMETCRKVGVQMILAVPMLANGISAGVMKKVSKEPAAKRAIFRLMQNISLTAQKINPIKGLDFAHKVFHSINAQLFGDSLRQIVVGGAHMPPEHLRTLNALGYAVTVGYGMTEIAITSYENKIDLKSRMTGSVGLPLPICEYKIRPDGNDPRRGELLVRCDAMHIGRLSEGKLKPKQLNAEGWFETGDVVRLGNGNRMWIEGRVKDMIIGPSGENVYPDEIEDAFASLEIFGKICVLGTKEDGKEKITLVISVADKSSDAETVSRIYDRAAEANSKLRSTARVSRMLITSLPLPTAATIKVRRAELAKKIEAGDPAFAVLEKGSNYVPAPVIENNESAEDDNAKKILEYTETVRGLFAEVLSVEASDIAENANFFTDLGGDSLQSLQVCVRAEETFGVRIPDDAYESCSNAKEFASLIFDLKEGNTNTHGGSETTPIRKITSFEETDEYAHFLDRLKSMEGGRNPYFVCHDSPLKDTSLMDGREVVNFGSYNYVGMSGRKETIEAAKVAADHYGTSASGSRLLGGEKPVHEELEKAIADWKHAEDAVVLVGGHSTNVTIVGNFCNKKDLILYDILAHNSISEGCRLSDAQSRPFPHNDYEALDMILSNCRDSYEKVLIVVEGVYSMDGDIAPIPEYVRIKKKYGCFLMVDEAHSACVLGKTGGGVDEYFGLKHDDIDIKMGTLSKGLGTCGGYIAGKKCLIEYLRYNLPGFVFSVGMSPVLAAASLEAVRLLKNEPSIMEDLHRNIDTFIEEAAKHGFDTGLAGRTAIIPILIGKDEDAFKLSNLLADKGVFVPPAVYPAVPRGKARLRFCVISDHKPEQIITAMNKLEEAAKELGITLPSPSKK